MRWWSCVAFVLAVTGCSLEESGIGTGPTSDGGPDVTFDVSGDVTVDVGTPDVVTVDVIEEPGPPLPCSTDASVCTGAIPSGWTLTMFAPNRNTACPSNATPADVVANPGVAAGGCTCSCNITTQPSCAIGTVNGGWGTNNCNNTNGWGPWTFATAGQCVSLGYNGNLADKNMFSKLGVTAGACNGAATTDPTKLTSTPMRTCVPAPACAEDVCSGTVPAGFRSCIAADGDLACPAGPFSVKAAVTGANATLACGACTACNVTQSGCGAATIKYWDDGNCTTQTGSIAADGQCNSTGNVHTNHITYEAAVQNVKCNQGTSASTVDLASKRTICCRP